jgi:hypothetical protein
MKPGVYVISDTEKRQLTTLDDLVYGSEADQKEVAHDLLNFVRDIAVELIANDDDVAIGKITLYIVQ